MLSNLNGCFVEKDRLLPCYYELPRYVIGFSLMAGGKPVLANLTFGVPIPCILASRDCILLLEAVNYSRPFYALWVSPTIIAYCATSDDRSEV